MTPQPITPNFTGFMSVPFEVSGVQMLGVLQDVQDNGKDVQDEQPDSLLLSFLSLASILYIL
jgi:hypothetical protein